MSIDPACDAAAGRQRLRHITAAEPPGIFNFGSVGTDLATRIVGNIPGHQLARKRPALASHVADIAHLHPGLLRHLPLNALFERLPEIHEAGDQAVASGGPLSLADQQKFLPPFNQHDYAGVDVGIMLVTASEALLSPTSGNGFYPAAAAGADGTLPFPLENLVGKSTQA